MPRLMISAPQGNGMKPVIAARLLSLAVLLSFTMTGLAFAQTPGTSSGVSKFDSYTPDQLMEKADQSGTGSASIVLEQYPGHFTMLGFRDRSGGAELHKDYADIDVILDGICTLIVGGTIPGPGEVRGALIQGGERTTLHKGDILHIPANTPHQMLLPSGGTLTYFVIKTLEPRSHE